LYKDIENQKMGRIKTTLIKRTGKMFIESYSDELGDFDKNKKIVAENLNVSKKIRNSIAGYIVRLKKQELKKIAK